MEPIKAVSIAKCDRFEYFQVGDEVYRIQHGYILDIHGNPCGMRFECPIHLFDNLLSFSPHIKVNGG